MKYFILGAIASGLLLFGCSIIYAYTGTTNLHQIYMIFLVEYKKFYTLQFYSYGLILGVGLISVGILFKLGAAPFHMWLPDVYEGVPTSITAIFAIVPKIALLNLLYILSTTIFTLKIGYWENAIIYSALFSIFIGVFGALYQVKIKRILAYSAINHVGFLLLSLMSLNTLGLFAMYFYIITYILISITIFSIILSHASRYSGL